MLFIGHYPLHAQEVEEVNIEELLLEQLSDEVGENVDVSELLERLSYFLKKPLNLNTATESDLVNLIFLTPQQITNLLYHRQVSGDFISLLELQGIVGFTPQAILLLLHFVTVEKSISLKNISLKEIFANDEQSFMLRFGRTLESRKGYRVDDISRSRYLGDPNSYALRYRWNYDNKIKISINAKKDAGEPFFTNMYSYGFDFYSGNIEFNALNKYIKKVVIGDYALQFGQGLVVWNGLSFGKGALIGFVAKQGVGLRGYTSLNENNFQRGISAKFESGNWEWTPFVAYNMLSGKVEKSDSMETTISTISLSGLHRTPTELAYRNQIKQLLYGSNISFRYKRWKLGFTYMGLQFNGNLKRGVGVRNIFDFEGRSLQQIGFSYQTTYRNYYFFGETAHSFNAGSATINGVIGSLHPSLSVFMTYRNYSRNYHNFYAQSLGESSSVNNEEGIYGGIVIHPSRKIEWLNYIDVFKFPWIKFRADAPSEGVDFFSQFSYIWYKKGKMSIRYRHRLKQENALELLSNTNFLADINRSQFRVDFQYKLNERWNIRTRSEFVVFKKETAAKSEGILVYQDVFWKGINRLQLNSRLAYFNTTNFDSRVYAYENDVLYASSFPVYFDKGIRSYLNVRWRIGRKVNIWARYALTYYFNRESIGSGLDEIEGKVRSDIKLQMRLEW